MESRSQQYIVYGIALLLVVLCSNCSPALKSAAKSNSFSGIDSLIVAKNFIFNADKALPMMTSSMQSVVNSNLFPPGTSGSQINISGNGSFLKVTNDSVFADLPYFGERQMGGGYNNEDSGIKFKGIADSWEETKDSKRGRYEFNFKIRNKIEIFQVYISVFKSGSASVQVTSSQRFPIRYGGVIKPLPAE
ncbi:uncharacterized protein DUF4251 [Flavobacteriaceae bacterium MAR_2009_75]|nr:uncharacterized protein DUF4251 [Flavobacteriaceae bacterium MAR_2009_75]